MNESGHNPAEQEDLRKRAEALLPGTEEDPSTLTPEAIRKIIHDLHVHRIELELQNDELQRAQEALIRARDNFSSLFDNAPAGYLLLDGHGTVLMANRTYLEMVGSTDRETRGTPFADAVLPEDRGIFLGRWNAFRKKPEDKDIEIRLAGPGGRSFPARVTGRIGPSGILPGDDGRAGKGLLLIVMDISEQKRAEEELRESEERFRAIHEVSFEGLLLHREGIVLDCNSALCRMSGYTREELIGMDGLLLFAEESRELASSKYRNQEEVPYEAVGLRKDGKQYPVQVEGRNVPFRGLSVRAVEIRDLTDAKRTEREKKETEEYIRTVLNTTEDGFWVVDPDRRLAEANRAYAEMTGYTIEELSRLRIEDIDAVEQPEETAARLEKLFQTGHDRFETRHRRKDGSLFDVEVSVSLLREQDRMVCFCRDITERKRVEAEMARELEEKRTLLREVHHRIKNNIASIESLLLLQADRAEAPEVNQALKDAAARVDSMYQLYRNMLNAGDYAELEAGDYLGNLAESIIRFFSGSVDVTLIRNLAEKVLETNTVFSLGIILNELLTNSVKYAFRDRESGRITVSFRGEGSEMVLEIRDDGAGLPQDFDIESSAGFGLGLVRMLCRQIKGSLDFQTDGGTVAVIRFPVKA